MWLVVAYRKRILLSTNVLYVNENVSSEVLKVFKSETKQKSLVYNVLIQLAL